MGFHKIWFVHYVPPPSPIPKGGEDILLFFFDRSCWHRRKTSCLLYNLNTLWNILMILGRNVEQDKMKLFLFVLFEIV